MSATLPVQPSDAATSTERKTVRPRFDVEDVRILLAAMFVYRQQSATRDVRELYDRIDALSKEIDRV